LTPWIGTRESGKTPGIKKKKKKKKKKKTKQNKPQREKPGVVGTEEQSKREKNVGVKWIRGQEGQEPTTRLGVPEKTWKRREKKGLGEKGGRKFQAMGGERAIPKGKKTRKISLLEGEKENRTGRGKAWVTRGWGKQQ